MTTSRLIALRLYNMTLGRVPFFSRLLRAVLLRILVLRPKNKYGASSRYFTPDQLDDRGIEASEVRIFDDSSSGLQ